ncbi:hypothetical protein KMT30_06770 [Streptomyces sp. IBSBF 2953]|nr:hypothetical protein [Streptomyces hayashii]
MLAISDDALEVVQRSFTMQMRVESWLGDQLLADDVPVVDGSEERDSSLAIPERVTLTVPVEDRGVSWDPTIDPQHPLAAYGQQLRISYGVEVAGDFEWITRGWFLVTGSTAEDDTVSVETQGLLTLIDEAKFASAFQPAGTLASTVRALVEPALTVEIDGALTDRAIPLGMEWDDDRLGALSEVLNAWPATGRVTDDGVLRIEPLADTGTPVLSLTDGVGGTVVRWQSTTSRDGAFNVVVAQGETSAGVQIQGVAYDLDSSNPYWYGGNFSPLPVPYTYSSPLLTTIAQCRAAADATLKRLRRTSSRKLTITMVPHPGLMTGDVVSVTGAGLTSAPCMIESLSLPYSPGEMSLTVRVL